jgi:hypothetical protein
MDLNVKEPDLLRVSSIAHNLLLDWNVPLSRQLSHNSDLLEEYRTARKVSNELAFDDLSYKFVCDLAHTVDHKSEREFINKFIFGVRMKIFRKGKIKEITAFLDQFIPTLLWISTKSKAFLLDLNYAVFRVHDV